MASEPKSMTTSDAVSFKDTLNLPQTDFPIRPNPLIDDAALLARWNQEGLYAHAQTINSDSETYILHDGPPYANGHIHLGHAYNYILKDIVTKSQRMMGKHVPVTPGWDCHGLPIEFKVSQEHPGVDRATLQKACRAYAQSWVEIQKEEFKALGVIMDWEHPYLTMNFAYEAAIIRAFGEFAKRGYIERKEKTVPWCFSCKTVLAAAEIEYEDRKDPSIYVAFDLTENSRKKCLDVALTKPVSLLIWTTTPWTLPLNRAVLAHPQTEYTALELDDRIVIIGAALAQNWCKLAEVAYKPVATFTSDRLKGLRAHHPFVADVEVPVLFEHWVGTTEGTALVHCAPGCGPQDYDVAIKQHIEVFSPVSADGTYTEDVGIAELVGKSVLDGQGWAIQKLQDQGKLLYKTSIRHSYPHCWRCRTGLIFRATLQWFCDLEKHDLKERALEAIETITFLPPKSKNYLKATISNRLEWCLSRQRAWGVPIPALLCNRCDRAHMTPDLINNVAQGISQCGIEFWNTVTIKELGADSDVCVGCGASDFRKEQDILDVWFDSGVSHWAVLKAQHQFPAQLYLEGLDQHRGWFQSSLLTSLALNGTAQTEAILTHGFTVDEHGQKMSKSRGNVVAPQDLIAKLGTDGLRLWAASINYEGDVIVSETLLKNVSEVYRKMRNTCRFLLANMYDFNHEKDALPFDNLMLIDQCAVVEAARINARVQEYYREANFTAVFHLLGDYAAVNLSQWYIAIVRDRLYVEQADGKERRSAQTACYLILDMLTKAMAPILSFTAELVSDEYQKNKKDSIHLQPYAKLNHIPLQKDEQWVAMWNFINLLRDAVMKAVEQERQKGTIKDALGARITLGYHFDADQENFFDQFKNYLAVTGQPLELFLKEFLITSQVVVLSKTDVSALEASGQYTSELPGLYVKIEKAYGVKCPRCWQWNETQNVYGLCDRCFQLVEKK